MPVVIFVCSCTYMSVLSVQHQLSYPMSSQLRWTGAVRKVVVAVAGYLLIRLLDWMDCEPLQNQHVVNSMMQELVFRVYALLSSVTAVM